MCACVPMCAIVHVCCVCLGVCAAVAAAKSGGAVDQEDVGAAERPRAAGCWEEPGWSWSHIQGTATSLCPVELKVGLFRD